MEPIVVGIEMGPEITISGTGARSVGGANIPDNYIQVSDKIFIRTIIFIVLLWRIKSCRAFEPRYSGLLYCCLRLEAAESTKSRSRLATNACLPILITLFYPLSSIHRSYICVLPLP